MHERDRQRVTDRQTDRPRNGNSDTNRQNRFERRRRIIARNVRTYRLQTLMVRTWFFSSTSSICMSDIPYETLTVCDMLVTGRPITPIPSYFSNNRLISRFSSESVERLLTTRNTRIIPVLYQVLNKQVPVPVSVHEAEVPVPVPSTTRLHNTRLTIITTVERIS